MLKRIIRIISNILLCLLPVSGVLIPYAPAKGVYSFSQFLVAYGILSIILLLLAFVVRRNGVIHTKENKKWMIAAWILFFSGIVFILPLNMDAPPPAEIWLKTPDQERFRFFMLLFASLLFGAGMAIIMSLIYFRVRTFNKVVVFFLLCAISFCIFDFADLFMVSSKLQAWVGSGKKPDGFFIQYDFHMNIRTAGRVFTYLATGWVALLLLRESVIKKWVSISVAIFSFAAIGMCVLFLLVDPALYFPFMVPAIAMAPAYWLGVALLNNSAVPKLHQ